MDTAVATGELVERIRKSVDAEPIDRATATAVAERLEACGGRDRELLDPLLECGQALGRRGHGREITYSRNVFIPLTNLCRDRCAYCTFAVRPDSPAARTYTLDEVRETSLRAREAGCREALFCLGDKPEVAYRGYRGWLQARGYASTSSYLVDACQVAFEAGLFPHTNAGIMDADELRALRPWNASMGLMLETTSERLRQKGGAHYYCPDKAPRLRIEMTREAGRQKIPFTSGILIGIGETPAERVDTLWTIREFEREGGHIQEVIVQNFHPKPDTPMAGCPAPADELMAGMVALARLILGPEMNLQAPPNLSPSSLELLVRSGLNDWGGVSPVSIDFINPEAPWPELEQLERRTEAAGYRLRERHGAYPRDIAERPGFFDPAMLKRLRATSDADGYPVGNLENEA